jgi:hypothetical protein
MNLNGFADTYTVKSPTSTEGPMPFSGDALVNGAPVATNGVDIKKDKEKNGLGWMNAYGVTLGM